MPTSLELARKAVLDDSEQLDINGVTFTVPPVPNAVMRQFCDLIRLWESVAKTIHDSAGTEDDPKPGLVMVDFLELVLPVVEALVNVFYLTVTTIDPEISAEAVAMLITPNNFVPVYQCLSRTSGLAPKLGTVSAEVKDNKKKILKSGRTGTK